MVSTYYKMGEKCVLCNEKIKEDYGKLRGTVVRSKNEKGSIDLIYVCSECQKTEDWQNNALIKGV